MQLAPARILIVDDHPNTASMLARVLNKFDTPVEVFTACSAEEALQVIGEGSVDVLITDFMMAGMSGLDLVEKLRETKEPAHTILITAYDTPGLAVSARQLNVNDYLVKPVQPEKIREIVTGVLKEIRPENLAASNFGRGEPFKILIADDYPDNIRLLSTRLRSEGYSFVTAMDGEETLRVVRDEKPDLVLLDVNMPKKDGFQVLTEMRADPEIAHIPVIIITAARIGPKDIRDGLTLGADDYVTKPIEWRELAARIQTKLRVKQAEDVLRDRNRQLGVLPEISQDLSERLDVEALTSTILNRSVQALEAKNGHLVIFHPDGSTTHQFHEMFDVKPMTWGEVQTKLVSKGIVAEVLSNPQPILIDDVSNKDNWLKLPKDPTQSALVIPLRGRKDVLGVLTLMHDQPGYFKADHQALLQAIASQAALAIENAQMFASERKRVNELVSLNQLTHQISQFTHSEEIFVNLPELIRQYMGYPIAVFWLKDGKELALKSIAGGETTIPKPMLEIGPQKALLDNQTVQLPNPHSDPGNGKNGKGKLENQSVIAVPVSWNSKSVGVLSIHSRRANAFQESDRVLVEMISAHVINVLERIYLFEATEKQQKRLSAVLYGAPDAILVFDGANHLELVNPAGQRIFSDVEAKVGRKLPKDHGYDELANLLDKKPGYEILARWDIQWPDGRTFAVSVTPIQEGGQVAVLHDVTHFKALDQLKNEFIATATHDLKNPIFAVMGYSDLMMKAGPLTETQTDFLQRIRKSATQMQDLVINLLEMARMEMDANQVMELIDLHQLLQEICNEFLAQAEVKSQSLEFKPANGPLKVKGDKVRLQQVARNLIGNAVKYTPENGHVTVSTEILDSSVTVRVEDDGIGIPAEALPHLFEKFYRVQSKATKDIDGNGLGLAIVKSIVERHGGKIAVESQVGKGSCFSFTMLREPTPAGK